MQPFLVLYKASTSRIMTASVCVEICHCSWKHLSPLLNFLSSYVPDDFYIAATELSFMLHNVQMQMLHEGSGDYDTHIHSVWTSLLVSHNL